MTINRLTELLAKERQDAVVTADDVRNMVNALETRLCMEVFLTHDGAPPGVYWFMRLQPPNGVKRGGLWELPEWMLPSAPGYPGDCGEAAAFDAGDIPLLAPPPYDEVYLQYCRWRIAQDNNDTYDESNAQRRYYSAYEDFARHWNRTHMPKETAVIR